MDNQIRNDLLDHIEGVVWAYGPIFFVDWAKHTVCTDSGPGIETACARSQRFDTLDQLLNFVSVNKNNLVIWQVIQTPSLVGIYDPNTFLLIPGTKEIITPGHYILRFAVRPTEVRKVPAPPSPKLNTPVFVKTNLWSGPLE